MKAANDAVPSSLPQSQGQNLVSVLDLDGLIQVMSQLVQKMDQLTEALIKQAEAISQLAMSNEALANAVSRQPEDDGEAESGYLS